MNNVMRHEYRPITPEESAQMIKLKDAGLAFWELLESIGKSRELSLAKTAVEEAVMWGTKHVTNKEPA